MAVNRFQGFANARHFGHSHETRACRFLQDQGLELLHRNFQCRFGEIDLVMRDAAGYLVFVEIRYRGAGSFGTALASVDWRKQRRIRATAACFLSHNPRLAHHPCRFDVIGMQPAVGRGQPGIDWIKNAFT